MSRTAPDRTTPQSHARYSEVAIPHVGVLWHRSGKGAATVIPADGCADLILLDGELLVAGPSTRSISARGSHGDVVGLRLAPGLAGHHLGVDPSEFRDHGLAADEVISRSLLGRGGSSLRAILEAAGNARGAENPLGGACAPLVSALPSTLGLEFDRSVSASTRIIRSAAARGISADRAAQLLGYSPRQFRRRMLSDFGYGYAALRRVLRVERASAAIRSGAPLVHAADRAGFADQAHMTREFRVIAGVTPAQLSARGA